MDRTRRDFLLSLFGLVLGFLGGRAGMPAEWTLPVFLGALVVAIAASWRRARVTPSGSVPIRLAGALLVGASGAAIAVLNAKGTSASALIAVALACAALGWIIITLR